MQAIIKRELSAYFTSPIGYVYLAVVWFFSGFFFFTGSLMSDRSSLSSVFSGLLTIVTILTPLLTMRLMTEDKRHRTDQALLTAPISLAAIVAGKFLAAAIIFTMGISITLVYAVTLSFMARMSWAMIWGNYIALLLLGFSFLSIGQFISSLTENQAIAAIGGFTAMMGVFVLDVLPQIIGNQRIAAAVRALSFINRYEPISSGIMALSSLFYFISVCGIFLFLTARVLEKRRWS
jgi:ABC-2 type transport system permease protein